MNVFENLETLQHRNIHFKHISSNTCPPKKLPRTQHWAKHMGQSDVILGTCWVTNWELKEDVEKPRKLMGTHCGKKSNTPPTTPKRKFDSLCAWFISLVANNFYAYMCSLPFSV